MCVCVCACVCQCACTQCYCLLVSDDKDHAACYTTCVSLDNRSSWESDAYSILYLHRILACQLLLCVSITTYYVEMNLCLHVYSL